MWNAPGWMSRVCERAWVACRCCTYRSARFMCTCVWVWALWTGGHECIACEHNIQGVRGLTRVMWMLWLQDFVFLVFSSPANACRAFDEQNRRRHSATRRVITLEFVRAPTIQGVSVTRVGSGDSASTIANNALATAAAAPSSAALRLSLGDLLADDDERRSLGSSRTPVSSLSGRQVSRGSHGWDVNANDAGGDEWLPVGAEALVVTPHTYTHATSSGATTSTVARRSRGGNVAYLLTKPLVSWSTEEVCMWFQHYFDFGTYTKSYQKQLRDATVTGADLHTLNAHQLHELFGKHLNVLPHHRMRIISDLNAAHAGYVRRPPLGMRSPPRLTNGGGPHHHHNHHHHNHNHFQQQQQQQHQQHQQHQSHLASAIVPALPAHTRSKSMGAALGRLDVVAAGAADVYGASPRTSPVAPVAAAASSLSLQSALATPLSRQGSVGSLSAGSSTPRPKRSASMGNVAASSGAAGAVAAAVAAAAAVGGGGRGGAAAAAAAARSTGAGMGGSDVGSIVDGAGNTRVASSAPLGTDTGAGGDLLPFYDAAGAGAVRSRSASTPMHHRHHHHHHHHHQATTHSMSPTPSSASGQATAGAATATTNAGAAAGFGAGRVSRANSDGLWSKWTSPPPAVPLGAAPVRPHMSRAARRNLRRAEKRRLKAQQHGLSELGRRVSGADASSALTGDDKDASTAQVRGWGLGLGLCVLGAWRLEAKLTAFCFLCLLRCWFCVFVIPGCRAS